MSELNHPASMYLRIAEDPEDLLAERSRLRRALALVTVVAVLVVSVLSASGVLNGAWGPWKLDDAVAQSGPPEDDDDNSGPGGGDDGDDDDSTGRESAGNT